MAFEFTENVKLTLPDIEKPMAPFRESFDHRQSNKLIIEVAAIHAGLTSNFNMYTAEALEQSTGSWVAPFPKPVIINHDEFEKPLGRVMAARMDQEEDGTRFVRLQVGITDPEAIEMIQDQRYLTGSIGGNAKEAKCSICNVDWAAAEMRDGLPCRHQKGKVYEGKVMYFELGNLSFREYSFVNTPADENSGIRSVKKANADTTADNESEDTWTHSVKMFAMDMDSPSIVEMSESNDSTNILESMTKKEAHQTYMNLKGTFLSVSAYDYKENDDEIGKNGFSDDTIINSFGNENSNTSSSQFDENSKESNMGNKAEENSLQEEEDIILVAENLSSALANATSDENSAETTASDESSENSDSETDPEEVVNEADDADENTDTPLVASDSDSDSEKDGEEEDEEGNEPASGEADEASETENGSDEGAEDANSDEEDEEEAIEEDPTRESDESSVTAELEAQIETLKTENVKLRKALHNMFVERVVDAKIARGLGAADERAALIEEHSQRTASSLADTLRDLEKQAVNFVSESGANLFIQPKSVISGAEDNVETANVEPKKVITKEQAASEVFHALLNGSSTQYSLAK